jgi:hypothetical protein
VAVVVVVGAPLASACSGVAYRACCVRAFVLEVAVESACGSACGSRGGGSHCRSGGGYACAWSGVTLRLLCAVVCHCDSDSYKGCKLPK